MLKFLEIINISEIYAFYKKEIKLLMWREEFYASEKLQKRTTINLQ